MAYKGGAPPERGTFFSYQCRIQTLGGGGPVIQTLKYGEGGGPPPKKIFRPFGPQFGLKIRLGPGPSPGSATGSKLGM